MMHKVLEDCSIITFGGSIILIAMLTTLPHGAIGFLPIIPLALAGFVFYLRRHAQGKTFFFEPWIMKRPEIGWPIFAMVVAIILYSTTAILAAAEMRRLDIPAAYNETCDALEKEVEEFFK